jgi:hypothetical protein
VQKIEHISKMIYETTAKASGRGQERLASIGAFEPAVEAIKSH